MDEVAEGEAKTRNDVQLEVSLTELGIEEPSLAVQRLTEDGSRTGFQIDLETSRVYQRTEIYKSDVSFTSSAVRTHAWSVFSGLSLSEVSVISAIALPLYLDEISNMEWYILSQLARTNLQVTSQVTTGSTPFDLTADFLPKTASSTTLGSIAPLKSSQKLKKSLSRLLLRKELIQRSSHSLINPKIPENPRTHVDAKTERPAAAVFNKSFQSSSKSVVKEDKPPLYKLAVLGDNNVGKTELVAQVNDSV